MPNWYILKLPDQTCTISETPPEKPEPGINCWGPFASKSEAISKRVGLIRAGKCQPQL